jgi:MOSC domain-containing protein YiiM
MSATTGAVAGLFRTPTKGAPPVALDEAVVRADWGLEGDRHARPGSGRQIVLTQGEVLRELDLVPGQTREQLTVDGLRRLTPGDRLDFGGAVFEITKPRVPCSVMDGIRPGLRRQLWQQGGWCARVITGGVLRLGDPVAVSHVDEPAWIEAYRDAVIAYDEFLGVPRPHPGWRDVMAALTAANRQAVADLENAPVVPNPPGPAGPRGHQQSSPFVAHDESCTAVIDTARRLGDTAQPWLAKLTDLHRQHAA